MNQHNYTRTKTNEAHKNALFLGINIGGAWRAEEYPHPSLGSYFGEKRFIAGPTDLVIMASPDQICINISQQRSAGEMDGSWVWQGPARLEGCASMAPITSPAPLPSISDRTALPWRLSSIFAVLNIFRIRSGKSGLGFWLLFLLLQRLGDWVRSLCAMVFCLLSGGQTVLI